MMNRKKDKKVEKKEEGIAASNLSTPRLQRALEKHPKLVSAIIVLAVAIPIVAVGAEVSPTTRTLPAARDFTMYNVDTLGLMKLSDYLDKVVFIDFMATWCPTCIQSMPDLRQLSDLYSSNPSFVLLSVTTDPDDNVSLMKEFKRDYFGNWTFAIPFDPDWVGQVYGVNGYPTYVIVDKEGQIAYRSVGLTPLDTLRSRINEVL